VDDDELDLADLVGTVVHYEVFFPSDPVTEITLVSIDEAAATVFGYELAAWERPQDQWHRMLHPGDYPRAVAASWATSRLGRPHSIEYRVTRSDGRTLWISDQATVERRGVDDELWRGTFTVIEPPPSSGWTPATLGTQIISALGEARARQLLVTLGGSEAERAEVIAELGLGGDSAWLADLLTDLEMDEPARLRVAGGLRSALGG
jgi:PAS domain-containing protein